MNDYRSFIIASRDWGKIPVIRTVPKGNDPWGILAPLRGTAWEGFIPVIPGNVLEEAVRGHATPLVNVIGRPPDALLRISPAGVCADKGKCLAFHDACQPGKNTPDCYKVKHDDPVIQRLAARVVLAWRRGFYLIVVDDIE